MATLAEIAQSCLYLPAHKSVMLTGCHGCGKTEWVSNTLAGLWGLTRIVTWHPAHAAEAAVSIAFFRRHRYNRANPAQRSRFI